MLKIRVHHLKHQYPQNYAIFQKENYMTKSMNCNINIFIPKFKNNNILETIQDVPKFIVKSEQKSN